MLKPATLKKLTDPRVQIVFISSPAGFGHIRVTEALFQRLPASVNPVVLGDDDPSLQRIHRLTSVNPVARGVFEWFQSGPLAAFSNRLYRSSLRSGTGALYRDLIRLIEQRYTPLTEILVASTHFGGAHKLAAIKARIQREKNVVVKIAQIVTDDTFQQVWYVDGADVIVAPSAFIRQQYVDYGKRFGGTERVEALPYPMSRNYEKRLTAGEMRKKAGQLDPKSREKIQVSIPVSGAAVGLDFAAGLMDGLHERSGRFHFHVVTKDASYMKDFLDPLKVREWVEVHAARANRGVVDLYDQLLNQNLISLEVTKPSEQSFKAYLGTQLRGGVILLFSEPVGQQELDNLAAMERNALVPSLKDCERLWDMAENSLPFDRKNASELLKAAPQWRAVRLPRDPRQAAGFIWWMQTSGVFSIMMRSGASNSHLYRIAKQGDEDGVERFWSLVASL